MATKTTATIDERSTCLPVLPGGNPAMAQAFQDLRRSSAAQPHRNLKRYRRVLKHRSAGWPEQA